MNNVPRTEEKILLKGASLRGWRGCASGADRNSVAPRLRGSAGERTKRERGKGKGRDSDT